MKLSEKQASDLSRYEALLQATADENNECDDEIAIQELANQFMQEPERVFKRVFKACISDARRIAQSFDDQRSPQVSGQQLLIMEDTWLAIGDKKHVPYQEARADHGERWLKLREENFLRAKVAFEVEKREMGRLIQIAAREDILLCEAKQMLLGNSNRS